MHASYALAGSTWQINWLLFNTQKYCEAPLNVNGILHIWFDTVGPAIYKNVLKSIEFFYRYEKLPIEVKSVTIFVVPTNGSTSKLLILAWFVAVYDKPLHDVSPIRLYLSKLQINGRPTALAKN